MAAMFAAGREATVPGIGGDPSGPASVGGPRAARLRDRLHERRDHQWIVLAVALAGLAATNFMVSVLAAVVGQLADEFATTDSVMVWVVLGPNLGWAVLAPTAGKLADLHGRRRVFLIALIGSMAFGGLSALAWSPGSLIAFRTLSATFGSATGPAAIAIISREFTAERRIQAMGYWSLVMAGGPVLGIVIGGPVIDLFSWRWLFAAQVPITLVALVLAYLVLPEAPRPADVAFDLPGTLLLGGAVTVLLLAVNRGPVWGWASPQVLAGFATAALLLALFVVQEQRVRVPLIPVDYFRRRNFALPMVSLGFTNFCYMGAGFVLAPLFMARVLEFSATRASYMITSRPFFFGIAGPVVGYLGLRLGERAMVVAGAAVVSLSTFGLGLMGESATGLAIFAALGVSGFGLGLAMPSVTTLVANAVADSDTALAGGALQMVSQLGTVAGIQVLQSVQVAREAAVGPSRSFTEAFVVGAVVGLFGLLAAAFVHRTAPLRDPAGLTGR